MEVHAHSHTVDPDSHRGRKKFTHYLWEFLMLFLAVFSGFLAENLREHRVEQRREKEYMKEIIENLEYDTIRCSKNALNNQTCILGIDSFRNKLKQAIAGKIESNALYYFSTKYGSGSNRAVFNTSTITELRNSGTLRIIVNRTLVNDLDDYYHRKIVATDNFLPDNKAVLALSEKIFSLLHLDEYVSSFDKFDKKIYTSIYDYSEILKKSPPIPLLQTDPKLLEQLYNEETRFEISIKTYNFFLSFVKEAATNLIAEIRKEYSLK